MTVQIIDLEFYEEMIPRYRGRPYGLYITKYEEEWVAIDNRKGHCYTKLFNSLQEAYSFLERLKK